MNLYTTTLTTILLTSTATAQVVDFETYPDGSPTVDRDVISDQFEPTLGIRFSLVSNTGQFAGHPRIAKVGAPLTAFRGCNGAADTPAPNLGVGESFLTDDASTGLSGNLLVTYTTPVSSASGTMIDVDRHSPNTTEAWTITAFDAAGNAVDSVVVDHETDIPCGGREGNGTVSDWVLADPGGASSIVSVLIDYTGNAGNVGLAFDNFTPSAGCNGGLQRYCSSTPNSSGMASSIDASGSTSVNANNLVLSASGAAPNRFGMFCYGSRAVSAPFGNGTRCIGGTVYRLYPPMRVDSSGNATRPVDLSAPPQPQGEITSGSTWYFQFIFRDPGTGAEFDLSDGLEISFCF